jgi:hypothetical protein
MTFNFINKIKSPEYREKVVSWIPKLHSYYKGEVHHFHFGPWVFVVDRRNKPAAE